MCGGYGGGVDFDVEEDLCAEAEEFVRSFDGDAFVRAVGVRGADGEAAAEGRISEVT